MLARSYTCEIVNSHGTGTKSQAASSAIQGGNLVLFVTGHTMNPKEKTEMILVEKKVREKERERGEMEREEKLES